jgi:hypothetical protein
VGGVKMDNVVKLEITIRAAIIAKSVLGMVNRTDPIVLRSIMAEVIDLVSELSEKIKAIK